MDKKIAQMQALLGDLAGYADALRVEAGEVFDRAMKYKPTAEALAVLEKQVDEKKAELLAVEAKLKVANEAHRRLLEILKQV